MFVSELFALFEAVCFSAFVSSVSVFFGESSSLELENFCFAVILDTLNAHLKSLKNFVDFIKGFFKVLSVFGLLLVGKKSDNIIRVWSLALGTLGVYALLVFLSGFFACMMFDKFLKF